MLTEAHELSELYTTNKRLRAKLNNLISEARINEHALRKYQSLELRLLSCLSFPELLQTLTHESRKIFGWDTVTLVLHDPYHETRQLLSQLEIDHTEFHELIFTEDIASLQNLYGTTRLPWLGAFDARRHERIFPETAHTLKSVALLPLERAGKLIGNLSLGSLNYNRFKENTATDFLQHLAAIIAASIDITFSHENLKYAGLTDSLTGVNNRRYFDQRLAEEVARSLRLQESLSCLFMDIDHFKGINDTFNHATGDLVLQQVAAVIKKQLRDMDIVARYGGEEFVILLSQADNHQAAEIAERIRSDVANWNFHSECGKRLNLTVSIGVASLEPRPVNSELDNIGKKLINLADRAHYQAKKTGRNKVISGIEFVYKTTPH